MTHEEGTPAEHTKPIWPETPLPIEVTNPVQTALIKLWAAEHTNANIQEAISAWSAAGEKGPAGEYRRLVENDPDAIREIFNATGEEKKRLLEKLYKAMMK